MRIISLTLSLCLSLFVTSCHYTSQVVGFEQNPFIIQGDDLMHGEWADDSRITKDIRCRGVLQGGELLCDIVNVSDHDVIINRGVCGFGYLIKYQTKTGKISFQERLTPIEWRFEHIEILGPLNLPEICIASWASTSFAIKLPADCEKLCNAVIRVPYVTYAEMGKCSNARDLRNIFDRNTHHVLVEFPKEKGDDMKKL